jgi:formylglycine-generating enzyme required for sulfatase activity
MTIVEPAPSDIPDLELLVQERPGSERRKFDLRLKAHDPKLGLNYLWMGAIKLNADPSNFFRQHLAEISQGSMSTFEEGLRVKGAYLSEKILPRELRSLLAQLRGKVRTLLVQSDDPWIPWEILCLPENPNSEAADGPFLCEAFAMTRWLSGVGQTLALPLQRIAVVVPRNSGLPEAEGECGDIVALAGGPVRQVDRLPARLAALQEAFSRGEHDGWHFTGHGVHLESAPDLSGFCLESNERLTPVYLSGKGKRMGGKHPLVFLNACSTGQSGVSLTDMGGWAPELLRAGAGAYIGTLWSINDGPARAFAKAFYTSFLSGEPIAEAVLLARQAIRSEGHSTWLAYTAFAHPLAMCVPTAAPCSPTLAQGCKAGKAPRARRRGKKITLPPEEPTRGSRIEVKEPLESERVTPERPAPGEERVNGKDGTILLYVPGGEFTLGAEVHPWSRPIHRVRLDPFWIGKFLVTNEQFACFLRENPDRSQPAHWEEPSLNPPQHPVVGLSWEEAQAYCRWAALALPTEAQWEAAARGTDQRPYPWGKELPTPLHANFSGTTAGTSPVGAYTVGIGPYGNFDQAGNVWEWCADPWDSTAYRQLEDGQWNPIAVGDTAVRALRGGSWINPAQDLHAAYRDRGTAKSRLKSQGFRCVWRPA